MRHLQQLVVFDEVRVDLVIYPKQLLACCEFGEDPEENADEESNVENHNGELANLESVIDVHGLLDMNVIVELVFSILIVNFDSFLSIILPLLMNLLHDLADVEHLQPFDDPVELYQEKVSGARFNNSQRPKRKEHYEVNHEMRPFDVPHGNLLQVSHRLSLSHFNVVGQKVKGNVDGEKEVESNENVNGGIFVIFISKHAHVGVKVRRHY